MINFKRSLPLVVTLLIALTGALLGASPALAASPYYFYAKGSQAISNTGMFATMTVATPSVAAGDFHSLMELSVQSSDQHQTVEVGWTVDPALNGDSNPHLFVYYWVNNVQKCYNTSCTGFVQLTGTGIPQAGQTLTNSAGKHFGIQHGGTPSGWWVYYDDVAFGYYPDSLWTSPTFTTAGFDQGFMEVAANVSAPCTDGGNGVAAGTGAAGIYSVQYPGQSTSVVSMTLGATNSAFYSTSALSNRSFYASGSGAC